ncbi:MAG: hypothetical protein DI538_06155 [Azospira oryzae]|nr:MAG: hypothetical protein DI538_06155 [Azospira oryzae]
MTPKVTIYIGAPIEYESERLVFNHIASLLTGMKQEALIIANVNIGQTQVDLIIVFEKSMQLIEVKKASTPIRGGVNGTWSQQTWAGTWMPIRNYYEQTMKAGYAVKDQLTGFLGKRVHYPRAVLLFVSPLHQASQIPPTDFKVTTTSLDIVVQIDNTPHPDGCSLLEWKRYLEAHNIKEVTSPAAACDQELFKAEQLLTDYHQSVIATYMDDTKKLVPVEAKFKDKKITVEDITNWIRENHNLLIAGPSGCAKTLLAKQLMIRLAQQRRITIYLEAKYVGPLLTPILDEEIKLLTVASAREFFSACRRLEQPITIILDGYNECSPEKQKRIDRCLLALCNRYTANVVIISQDKNTGSSALKLNSVIISPPDLPAKKAIAMLYCSSESVKALEPLLDTATSGLEAMIIGTMGAYPVERKSKFALFDFYVRAKLQDHASAGTRALALIANHLANRISFVLSVRELERLADEWLIASSVIDKLIKEKLLHLHFDKISFGHELFQHAYTAAAVAASAENEAEIITALNAPINAGNRIFMLGAIEEENMLQAVLNQITSDVLIISLYLGEAGEIGRQWVLKQYVPVIRKMQEEIEQLQFCITEDQWHKVTIIDNGLYEWTATEFAFIYALPELLLHGSFTKEILQMADLANTILEKEFKRLLPQAQAKKIEIRSNLFAAVFCPTMSRGCGFSCAITALRSGFVSFRIRNEYVPGIIKEMLPVIDWSNGSLFVALALGRFNEGVLPLFPMILENLTTKWKYLPYHLRLELLDAMSTFTETNTERLQLINAINSLPQSRNIIESSSIFEALQALGGLEADESSHKEVVRNQLKEILTDEESTDKQRAAYGLFSAQFDHPFSSAYLNVIDCLSQADKKKFLVMSIQGTSDNFFMTINFLMLAKLGDPSIACYLEKARTKPPMEKSSLPQDDLLVYLLAHIIQAQCDFDIDSRVGTYTLPKENAVCAVAEINYRINRKDITLVTKKNQCESLWAYLQEVVPQFAVGLLYQAMVSLRSRDLDLNLPVPVVKMQDIFPDRLAEFARKAILHSQIQQAFYDWDKTSDITRHAITLLQSFGNELDIPLLKSAAGDTVFGTHAIAAIRRIQERAMT